MKAGLCTLLFSTYLIVGCSSQQLGSAAYNSLGSSECKEKTGGQACDLDERSIDERLINGAPDQYSTEALAKQAEKERQKSQEK